MCQFITKRTSNIKLESIPMKSEMAQKISSYSNLIQKEGSQNQMNYNELANNSSEGEQTTTNNIEIQQYLTSSFNLMKQQINDQSSKDNQKSLRSKEACSSQLLQNINRQEKQQIMISNISTKQSVQFQQIKKKNLTLRHHAPQKNMMHQRYLSSQNVKQNNPEKLQQSSQYFQNSDQSFVLQGSNQNNSSKALMQDDKTDIIQNSQIQQQNQIKAADFISIIDDFKNQEIKQFFSHFNIKKMKTLIKRQRATKLCHSNSHSQLQQSYHKKLVLLDHLKTQKNHPNKIPLGSDVTIQSTGLSHINQQLHQRQQPSVIMKSLYQTHQGSMTEHSMESSDIQNNQQTIATGSLYGDQSMYEPAKQKPLIQLPQASQLLQRAPVILSNTHKQTKPFASNNSNLDILNPQFFESIISSYGDEHPIDYSASVQIRPSKSNAFSREKVRNNGL